jgi:hypothetical protein
VISDDSKSRAGAFNAEAQRNAEKRGEEPFVMA